MVTRNEIIEGCSGNTTGIKTAFAAPRYGKIVLFIIILITDSGSWTADATFTPDQL